MATQNSIRNSRAELTLPSQASGDIFYASSSTATTRLAKGSDGQVLTLASGVPSWAAGGGGGDPYHTLSIPMFNTNEVSDASSGSTLSQNAGHIRGIQNTPTSGEYVSWYNQLSPKITGDLLSMTKLYGAVLLNPAGGSGSGVMYYHWLRTTNDSSSTTGDHIGVQWDKVSATTTPASSSANGTTQQKVTLSGVTLDFGNNADFRYSFKFDGTTVSFYVNGVLKNTHSTNVPRQTSSQNYNYVNCLKSTISTSNIFVANVSHFNLMMPTTA